MATLSIVITALSQEQMDLNVMAFALATGYKPTVLDAEGDEVPNPVTAEEHSRNQVRKLISDKTRDYILETELNAARVKAAQDFENGSAGVTIELV